MKNTTGLTVDSKADLEITRIIDAPREHVFKAWTDPWLLAKWWGPKGFTNPLCELDLKPDGRIRINMQAPDGTVFRTGGVFHQIMEPEKLAFTSTAFEDEWGELKLKNYNTVRFIDEDGKTKLAITVQILELDEEVANAVERMPTGWAESLDKLEKLTALK